MLLSLNISKMNTKRHKIAIAAFLFLIIGSIEMHPVLKYILLGIACISIIIVFVQLYQNFKSRQNSKQNEYD